MPRIFFHSYHTHHCKIINTIIQLYLTYAISFAPVTYDRAFTLNSLVPPYSKSWLQVGDLGHEWPCSCVHTGGDFNCIGLSVLNLVLYADDMTLIGPLCSFTHGGCDIINHVDVNTLDNENAVVPLLFD